MEKMKKNFQENCNKNKLFFKINFLISIKSAFF